ncbi:T9SS type A sorting domain-containing protein [Flavobacterium sp. HNIBRBA15423]|uniref:T9SS type A sorting domain-containing protein n=1 Tax=Flavobacterium sp. HNIBRBA15423 TaxID=3458683 RepID=UPI004045057C
MKKKLLSFVITCLVLTTISFAQTKVWDFGNDTANWPLNSLGVSDNDINDNLGIYMGITSSSNIGIVEASPKTFPDSYVGANRFKLNGGGGVNPTQGVYVPTQRYVYFATAGNCTIKIWFRTGGSGTRTLYVTDGNSIVGSLAGTNSSDGLILETTYTGSATNLYIFGDQSCNLYKIEVIGALGTTTLGSDNFKNKLAVNAYTFDNQVYISNIISDTKVNVYNITGQLIKSLNTSIDTNFELTKGFYIVNMESNEGKKSMKVLIK